MKKVILTAAIAAAIALPSFAAAQTGGAMPAPPTAASLKGLTVCIPPRTGETANATMGGTALYCRPVNVAKLLAARDALKSAMAMHAMAADQSAAMAKAANGVNAEFHVQVIPGTNGNPNN
ncbi:MAG TPA: hypothetical protein VGP41_11180 [Candidatus Lustribacter sp.]|nr:hypothetical protein [Candidatus Lustribacter sp.]